MKKLFFFILMIISLEMFAQVDIVPMPASAAIKTNVTSKFEINNRTIISYNDVSLKKDVEYFIKKIKSDFGVTLSSKL
ncbi:MAG: hypothetical protein LH615_11985, partial [Ferruginibacter sp.]|nr:hypothetical protein [Ferruginibacter sp.]